MATYQELATLFSESTLKSEITVAIAVSANEILDESPSTPNHAQRYAWAAKATSNPNSEAQRFLIGVLAANKDATVAQIENASDAVIQTNVDGLVDLFALADAS